MTAADRAFRGLDGAPGFAVGLGGRLLALEARWRERAGRPRRTSATQKLIERIPARPILDINAASELLEVSYPQARIAVLRLEETGVLRPVTIGRKRNRAWEAPDLLDLLDEFEFEALTPARYGEPRRPFPRSRSETAGP
ncbi:MAG: hypothetical protein A2X23_13700 [Chloroflexi bacterium GWC2_73_18]|nr:MAG: hypothetical protein A2X23_13700 [Chloroflexi bacterium GWC2_73_18]